MDLNKVMLIGNLTREPETRTTPTGQNVCTFGLATNLTWTDQAGQKQTRAEFHNIVAWRKLADICAQYLHKGNKIYIEGRLQNRDWQDKEGNKRQRTEVVADNMIMLGSKGEGMPSRSDSNNFGSAPSASTPESIPEIQVDDIPF